MTREPDTLSEAPPYRQSGVVFYCWITDRGELAGAERHEWRTTPRGGIVGRNPGQGTYFAMMHGRPLGSYPSLREAMNTVAFAMSREPDRRAA